MTGERMTAAGGMDATRFGELAAAWGGDVRRWPQEVREKARAWMAACPTDAERILADAGETDAVLQASPSPVVSTALRDRVLASAATAGWRARTAWRGVRQLLWIGGVGWAAAACAGVVFGTSLSGHLTARSQADAVLEQAMTSGIDDTEILG